MGRPGLLIARAGLLPSGRCAAKTPTKELRPRQPAARTRLAPTSIFGTAAARKRGSLSAKGR